MIGRADIEGSKSNVAMNAWLPQASSFIPSPNSGAVGSISSLIGTSSYLRHAMLLGMPAPYRAFRCWHKCQSPLYCQDDIHRTRCIAGNRLLLVNQTEGQLAFKDFLGMRAILSQPDMLRQRLKYSTSIPVVTFLAPLASNFEGLKDR